MSYMSTRSQSQLQFKTPMAFVPASAHKPSPSRDELWKQELGLGDDSEPEEDQPSNSDEEPESDQLSNNDAVIELQAIKAELKRKDEQREDLLLKLKSMTDKTSSYKGRLQKLESSKKSQIKIMKKTHESQIQMKADLINNLEELIEEQEGKIDELENRIKGENPTSSPHNSKVSSIRKLVDSINDLHNEKSRIHEMWLSAQSELETVKQEHEKDISVLQSEMSDSETKNRKLQAENIKLQNSDQNVKSSTLESYEERVHDLENDNTSLKKKVRGLEQEQYTKEAKQLEVQRTLEREGMETRKKLRDMEAKYTNLAATPPKVKKISVVSEETQRQLDQMIVQNNELESLLSKTRTDLNAKISALRSDAKTLQESLKEVSDKEKKATLECHSLQASLKAKGQVEEAVRERDTRIQQLETEVYSYKLDLKAVREGMEASIVELEEEKKRMLEEEKAKAERGSKSWQDKLQSVLLQLNAFARDVKEMKMENKDLKIQSLKMATSLKPAIRDTQKKILQRIEGIDERNKLLVSKYKKEMALRKKYHNELVDLKGNIRVFCRVRPVIREDGGGKLGENVVSFDEDDDGVLNVLSRGATKTFEMDRVFTSGSTQEEVFEEAKALITSCVDGYNVCIFAYGQTGSGKTFTMEGPSSNPGLNQRALRLLFEETADRAVDWHFCINVSVMEIYNEMLRDLLSYNPSAKLDIKQGKEGLFVPGLSEVEVASADDVNEVFEMGKRNRATAGTEMNEHSSRSHAILSVTVIGVNKTTKLRTIGKLHLVDLAGSERVSKSGSEGARMKEAQNINKSLSALGDVIHSLKNDAAHIPYRNSKLTYLLQESLGGDSKTLMVVQLSPVEKNVSETVCSLNFAQRVRAVELGQATRKTETSEAAQLKGRLRELEGGSPGRSRIPRNHVK